MVPMNKALVAAMVLGTSSPARHEVEALLSIAGLVHSAPGKPSPSVGIEGDGVGTVGELGGLAAAEVSFRSSG